MTAGDNLRDDRGGDGPLVRGRIVITAAVPALYGAAAHVSLEDVSFADAAAETVAETTITGIRHDPSHGETSIEFELRDADPAIEPGHTYTVRVWVDADDDGRPGPGDLYSDQSYPLISGGFGREVTIVLNPH